MGTRTRWVTWVDDVGGVDDVGDGDDVGGAGGMDVKKL